MSSPPVKKRKFVVLKRRPQVTEPIASDSTPEPINDDIYDLSAHIKEVKPTEVKPDPAPIPPSPAPKVEKATPKKPTRATRQNSKPALIEIDSEEDVVVEDESDDDIDPDVELQQALARARKVREEKETAERLLRAAEEEKKEAIEEAPVVKKKKEKTYRGEKVCFSLAFPKIEDKSWNPVLFITRSLIPFYEIQEKLTQLLHQRCAEDDIYPPPEHVLDDFIFTFRGSRIFRNSTCSTMGITTRDPKNCPEVQWLNKEDAEKFRLRTSNGGESDSDIEEVVEELDELDDVEDEVEEEPEPEEPEEEDMELSMTGKDKKPVVVRVGLTREFQKLAEHYAKEKGVAVGSVQLWFDGEKIDLKKRVEEVDVEDEDMLEVRLV